MAGCAPKAEIGKALGNHILYCDVTRSGQLVHAVPQLVLYSDASTRTIASWRPIGTPFLIRQALTGQDWKAVPIPERAMTPWELASRTWRHRHIIHYRRLDDWYSVWLMYDRHFRFASWYVNFETPALVAPDPRYALQVQTQDLCLDLHVASDMRGNWKDVMEFRHSTGLRECWDHHVAKEVCYAAVDICRRGLSRSFPFAATPPAVPAYLQLTGERSAADVSSILTAAALVAQRQTTGF